MVVVYDTKKHNKHTSNETYEGRIKNYKVELEWASLVENCIASCKVLCDGNLLKVV